MSDREPCPYCFLEWGHARLCIMFGLTEHQSSLLYGWPVCQCCGLRFSPERSLLHARRQAARHDAPVEAVR